MLDRACLKESSLDMERWSQPATGKFSVKSYFLHLASPLGNKSSLFSNFGFSWNIIWESLPQLKPFFCVWEFSPGKILTCNILRRRYKFWSTVFHEQRWFRSCRPFTSSLANCLKYLGISFELFGPSLGDPMSCETSAICVQMCFLFFSFLFFVGEKGQI